MPPILQNPASPGVTVGGLAGLDSRLRAAGGRVIVVGTVKGSPVLTVNRRRRAVLAFTVLAQPSGRPVRVVVRGAKARAWAAAIYPGAEVRLDGDARPVLFFRVKRVRPVVERWEVRKVS